MKRAFLLLTPVLIILAALPFLAQTNNITRGDCTTFSLVHPDQVRHAPTGYEWSPVDDAELYRVAFIRQPQNEVVETYDLFAPQTNIYLDVTDIIGVDDMVWQVTALNNGEILCSTEPSETMRRSSEGSENCMDFRILAPTTVFSYEVTYEWSRVRDADEYKVLFWRRDDGDNDLAVEFVVDAPETSLTVAMGTDPTGSNVQWEVLALKGGAILCSTGRTAIADHEIAPLSGVTPLPNNGFGSGGALAPDPPTLTPSPIPVP